MNGGIEVTAAVNTKERERGILKEPWELEVYIVPLPTREQDLTKSYSDHPDWQIPVGIIWFCCFLSVFRPHWHFCLSCHELETIQPESVSHLSQSYAGFHFQTGLSHGQLSVQQRP